MSDNHDNQCERMGDDFSDCLCCCGERREIERLREAISERDEELRSLRLIIANKDARFQRVREALGDKA